MDLYAKFLSLLEIILHCHVPSGRERVSQMKNITAVAARQAIFIEAANKNIVLMCFIAVGIAEVSSCEVTVEVGKSAIGYVEQA
jgi:hypothetical protein